MEYTYRIGRELIDRNSNKHLDRDELFVYCWIHHYEHHADQSQIGWRSSALLDVWQIHLDMGENTLLDDERENRRYITKIINKFIKNGIISMIQDEPRRFYNWDQQSTVEFNIGEVFVEVDLRKVKPDQLYEMFQLEYERMDIFNLWKLEYNI